MKPHGFQPALVLITLMVVSCAGLAAETQLTPGVASAYRATEAEGTSAPIKEPSPNDLRELTRLLADERIQHWLTARADEASEAPDAGRDDGMALQEWLIERLAAIDRYTEATAAAWEHPGAVLERFADAWAERMGEGETLRSIVYVIIFLIIGAGLEWLYWRYAWSLRRRIELAAELGESTSIKGTTIRALLSGFGITLFAAGTIGGFLGFEWSPLVEIAVLTLLLAVVTVRLANTLAVFTLCPRVAALRPLPIDTPTARFVYWWTMASVTAICTGGLAAEAIREMRLVPEAALLVSSTTATLVALMAIIAIWQSRAWRARLVAGRRRRVAAADLAPMGGTLLVVVVWLLWLIGARALMWTLLVAAAVPLALWCSSKLIRGAFEKPGPQAAPTSAPPVADSAAEVAPHDGEPSLETVPDAPHATATDPMSPAPPSQPKSKPRRELYAPVLERFARFILFVTAALLLVTAWGLDVETLSASTSGAGMAFEAIIDILVVLLIADLIWVGVRTAIDNRLADYVPPLPGHAPGPDARLATLLPLIRKVLMVTLLVMVTLVALSSLGVNIGPLLAGAGVIGIAVGFGAQTLVRDIVSGIFFLLDDAFRVGEYIEVGSLRGTVEAISVRSLRLRHHRGPVHTVPFGEMTSLTNHSRDWVIMKLEFRVPFDTDLKLVKKLVKKVGDELNDHEEVGPSILEPLKSQGVRRMEEFNMVVGVKFMTKPGEQWQMRKEVFQRVRDAFDHNGIRLAERNVKVEVVGAQDMSPEVREAAAGAAQQVIEPEIGVDGAKPAA